MKDSDINDGAKWCLVEREKRPSTGWFDLAGEWAASKGVDPRWVSEIAERAHLEARRETPFSERTPLKLVDRDEYGVTLQVSREGCRWVARFGQGVEPRPQLWSLSSFEGIDLNRVDEGEEQRISASAELWFQAEYLNFHNGSTFLQEREALRLGLGGGAREAVAGR